MEPNNQMVAIKKVALFYFSGTGNAKRIALWFAAFASKRGVECEISDIVHGDWKIRSPFDPEALVVIISPIHGFNYPQTTLSFIERFPRGGNRVVLMNTRAGMKIGKYVTPGLTGVAFYLASLMLKFKGYRIAGQIPFDMPSNWISLHPALSDNAVRFLHQKNYERAEEYASILFSGKTCFVSYSDVVQDVLISPVSLGYYLIGRFVFAKTFYANAGCDNCGLCIKQCPVQAIGRVNQRPFWTLKCESCMKCMNTCPRTAIDTAHGLLVAVGFLSSALFTWVVDKLYLSIFRSGPLGSVLSALLFIGMMCLFYRIQHWLLRNKTVARLISYCSLTHYKFWGRYRSISDDKWQRLSCAE